MNTQRKNQNIADGCARSERFQQAIERKRTPKARAAAYADAKCGVGQRETDIWREVYRARLRLYLTEAKLATAF